MYAVSITLRNTNIEGYIPLELLSSGSLESSAHGAFLYSPLPLKLWASRYGVVGRARHKYTQKNSLQGKVKVRNGISMPHAQQRFPFWPGMEM